MSACNLTPCPEDSPQQRAEPSNSTRHFRPSPSPL
ncbi:hypothetical protein T12_15857 [Trichinella patagoniensis]|uniref:Uncharacterized protein n=1 Tax=Trichinella patagoniensis TaxID=990121 RepID=A0A0V0XDS4_9BILA|nr:hypothetical protein T12_15857 [Trichinella patagoniensis]